MVTEFCFSGEAARRAGISRETLLKWESRGIIESPQRIWVGPARQDRIYSETDIRRITQLARERGLNQAERKAA